MAGTRASSPGVGSSAHGVSPARPVMPEVVATPFCRPSPRQPGRGDRPSSSLHESSGWSAGRLPLALSPPARTMSRWCVSSLLRPGGCRGADPRRIGRRSSARRVLAGGVRVAERLIPSVVSRPSRHREPCCKGGNPSRGSHRGDRKGALEEAGDLQRLMDADASGRSMTLRLCRSGTMTETTAVSEELQTG